LHNDGSFRPQNPGHRKRPRLLFHESADISNSLKCISILARLASDRFPFELFEY
jgi:hypothetical protein